MLLPDPAPQRVRAPLTKAIVKHRNILWGALIVIYLLAFNGHWRVGRDSAVYRGLGHALASGQGYHFGKVGSEHIYPGFPILLAGIEKVFGAGGFDRDPVALPAILLVHLFSLGCLIFTYKLIRLRHPQWVAVIVTFAVGINGWFLELTNEMLADIPFLFGMLVALYGWERLRISISDAPQNAEAPPERRSVIKPVIFLIVGLTIAAVMRPTFWILAIAWVLVCVWGLAVGPRRRFYAVCLGVLLFLWLAVALLDPRVRGFDPLGGGYEQEALAARAHVVENLKVNIPKMLGSAMAYGFFGQKWIPNPKILEDKGVPGMTDAMSLIAILAALLLLRRQPLWTLLIFGVVGATLLLVAVPRYYVMVLPLMALSWILLTSEIALRVPHRWLEVVLLAGILMLVLPNFSRCCKVIGEQRGWNASADEGPKWKYVMDMSRTVQELVPPGEKVIGPGASIMSFLSGREVVMQRDILPANKTSLHWPAHLAALNIKYAVFPSRLYAKGERSIRELMDRGVIVPTERVAKVGDIVLAKVEIVVPPPGVNWKNKPVATTQFTARTTAGGTTRPSKAALDRTKRHLAVVKKQAAERKALADAKHRKQVQMAKQQAAEKAAARKRKAARLRREQAATQPATTQSTRRGRFSGHVPNSFETAAFPYFDEGGSTGQSLASRSDSMRSRVNARGPRLIPWQRFDAPSQFSADASVPSQNGQVRHWSGRTS